MIRFGLCCIFNNQPINFNTTTATFVSKLSLEQRIKKISNLCLNNSISLLKALDFCSQNNIGCFRVTSRILPLKTHPKFGYDIKELPDHEEILSNFNLCKEKSIRKCFHPDQFVVLNSPKKEVVESSLKEIEYQSEVSALIGADVVNTHAGGGYGNKKESLKTLSINLKYLSDQALSLLTLENDDKTYTPEDILSICIENKIPLVYDVHHHRCNPDAISIEKTTDTAMQTWNREPLFHISSPINGWGNKNENSHHDYIDIDDFPEYWKNKEITIEIEAKAKEVAIEKLMKDLTLTQ